MTHFFPIYLLSYAVIQELNRLPQQLLQLLGNRLQGELGVGAAVGAAEVGAQDHGPEDTRIKVKYLYFWPNGIKVKYLYFWPNGWS